jgi:hypothetical protein
VKCRIPEWRARVCVRREREWWRRCCKICECGVVVEEAEEEVQVDGGVWQVQEQPLQVVGTASVRDFPLSAGGAGSGLQILQPREEDGGGVRVVVYDIFTLASASPVACFLGEPESGVGFCSTSSSS